MTPGPTATAPSDRTNPADGRGRRRGRLVPLITAGAGVVLVVVSVVLLLHNRSLPDDFGAVPGDSGQSAWRTRPPPVRLSPLAPTAPSIPSTTSSSSARTTTLLRRPTRGPSPRQLILPRFGVRADALPVTSIWGVLEVQESPQQLGRWVGSALPAARPGAP